MQGKQQVRSDSKGKKHIKKAKIFEGNGSQTKLASNQSSNTNISLNFDPKQRLTPEQEVQNAEILPALYFVKNNYSFAIASDDAGKFELMFPDSKIAEGYNISKARQR